MLDSIHFIKSSTFRCLEMPQPPYYYGRSNQYPEGSRAETQNNFDEQLRKSSELYEV